eukprot:TRINITY_DN2170_c0_g1_i1.p1 TRINITY_DN2170_c0_g1~~TRINITY_DN2170_c0_g1_i1.p1  ORF type:complete len:165 (+),score=34.94 TRINITY_DN2170_c0_g1_i1:329-823(+)
MRKSGRPKPKVGVRVVWDEENLNVLEASKTPKQKINEPKTPYHAPASSDGTLSPMPDDDILPMEAAVHAEAIRHALSEVASTSGESSSRQRGGWTSSEDEGDDRDFDAEGSEMNGSTVTFEEHRRKHYDEFRKSKMMRVQGSKPEEEVEDEQDKKLKIASCPHV